MQFDVSSLRVFSRFILGLSMLNVNGEQQWLCKEKADFRTLELLSKENIFVCLFCLPGPPSPSLLISDSAVQRPLSWPRRCHLSTDQTCCTCNVHRGRLQVFWVFSWKCLTMSSPLSRPEGWPPPWELWAEPVLFRRAESSSRMWPSLARSLPRRAGRSQPCHISHSEGRLFTKDDTLLKLKNGILRQAQWDFSSLLRFKR